MPLEALCEEAARTREIRRLAVELTIVIVERCQAVEVSASSLLNLEVHCVDVSVDWVERKRNPTPTHLGRKPIGPHTDATLFQICLIGNRCIRARPYLPTNHNLIDMANLKTWLFNLLLLVGGPLAIFATYTSNGQIAKVLDHGKTVTADINDVEWTTKNHIVSHYKLDLSFTPAGGTLTKAKMSVDSSIGASARDDKIQTIDVKYLPEDPSVIYPADLAGPSDAGFYLGGGMFFAGLALLISRRRRKSV